MPIKACRAIGSLSNLEIPALLARTMRRELEINRDNLSDFTRAGETNLGNSQGTNLSSSNLLGGGTVGQNKGVQSENNSTQLNQYKIPGNAFGQGNQGMGNQFSGTQGSGNQGLSGAGNKATFVPQQSGQQGVGGQGGGGTQRTNNSQSQKKDNNNSDDPNKKGNRSDIGSPRTNFSMERGGSTGGIDVGGVVDQEKAQTKRDVANGKQPLVQNILTDKPDANTGLSSAKSSRHVGGKFKRRPELFCEWLFTFCLWSSGKFHRFHKSWRERRELSARTRDQSTTRIRRSANQARGAAGQQPTRCLAVAALRRRTRCIKCSCSAAAV